MAVFEEPAAPEAPVAVPAIPVPPAPARRTTPAAGNVEAVDEIDPHDLGYIVRSLQSRYPGRQIFGEQRPANASVVTVPSVSEMARMAWLLVSAT